MTTEKGNRVLSRRGARVVTTEEAASVQGASALPTDTVCTYKPSSGADGDTFLGEC
jgi:hypothetical protein